MFVQQMQAVAKKRVPSSEITNSVPNDQAISIMRILKSLIDGKNERLDEADLYNVIIPRYSSLCGRVLKMSTAREIRLASSPNQAIAFPRIMWSLLSIFSSFSDI